MDAATVFSEFSGVFVWIAWIVVGALLLRLLLWLIGLRYIPHDKVGIIEKLWSAKGSLKRGKIIAVDGEAGFQAQVLRGGLHWLYFPFQYRIHKVPLVAIAEGRIGYVYARDGVPLSPMQTLGKAIPCDNFQDTASFLRQNGQRGRQRGILREGVYAMNLAQFVVMTENRVYSGPIREADEGKYLSWKNQLEEMEGFAPIVIGRGGNSLPKGPINELGEKIEVPRNDTVGIVTVHDGPPLDSREIIAPETQDGTAGDGHNCFQDPETFLDLGGRRGRQLQVLSDGTFFINRWFATVETCPKTIIPIGYVGVVVSYYGVPGEDVTGEAFRHGEQVEHGYKGVWKRALTPGKYPLNPYAVTVELVPTTNFVLRWITGQTEAHNYDEELKSIELITADGFEPMLPLSLVLHIDYENAPRVVQRFGNVHRLITQTLDPILSAYFRDVAQDSNMLDLLTKREEIQRVATAELGRRFTDYDITCVAVLIGRPESKGDQYSPGKDPIEQLFEQLRSRRHAEEQLATYAKQEEAAKRLKALNDARASAEKQAELTQTRIDVDIAGNRGEAQLAEARRLAERDAVRADGEARANESRGRGEGRAAELRGKGEAASLSAIGLAEANVFHKKIEAYRDPRLYALQQVIDKLSSSRQPLVPERLMMMPGNGNGRPTESGALGLVSQLVALLTAEKAGLDPGGDKAPVAADAPESPAE